MWRLSLICLCVAVTLLGAQPSTARAQSTAPPKPKTDAEKIANAMTAAPPEVAQHATVKDWPAAEGGEFRVLRRGTNKWTCLPSYPQAPGNEPMCLDGEWEKVVAAYVSKGTPSVRQVGLAYMLSTQSEGSNTDPFATGATPDNHWHEVGPHVMIVFPDAKMFEGISADPKHGGPYVMWRGTPYAHVMWPVR